MGVLLQEQLKPYVSFDAESAKIRNAYRWITQEEQRLWAGFLVEAGLLTKTDTRHEMIISCGSSYVTKTCKNGCKRYTSYVACGLRGLCPRCSMSYAYGRAEIRYRQLRQITKAISFDLKQIQFTLTLPEELQRIETKQFKKIVKLFMSKRGIETYSYCIQSYGKKNVLSKRLHAHILSYNFTTVVYGDGVGLGEAQYYFDVDEMRSDWKESIKEVTSKEFDGEVDLHTEYASVLNDSTRVKHQLAYVYRYNVVDLFNGVVDGSVDTSYVHNLQLEAWRMLKEKPRLVHMGLFSSTRRQELSKILDVKLETMKYFEKQIDCERDECEVCHERLFVIDRGKYLGDNEPVRFGV